jgi:hypothetical protein
VRLHGATTWKTAVFKFELGGQLFINFLLCLSLTITVSVFTDKLNYLTDRLLQMQYNKNFPCEKVLSGAVLQLLEILFGNFTVGVWLF